MQCPACGQDLIVVEHDKIELDYCVQCQGVWFDSGELDLLLETVASEGGPPLFKQIEHLPETGASERKRSCPRCRRKMKAVTVEADPPVMLDACKHGHGLWFDKGEVGELLEEVLRELPHGPHHTIQFLGKVIRPVSSHSSKEEGK